MRLLKAALIAGACLVTGLGQGALAQPPDASAWPTKAIKIIVTYPTAGVSDNAARVLAERLTKAIGQPVLVENRAGAGGTLGADVVSKAAPDGYTIGFASMSVFTLGPYVMNVNYDSLKDFQSSRRPCTRLFIYWPRQNLPARVLRM